MNPTKEGKSRLLYIPAAVAAFHLAYSIPGGQFFALVYLVCLLQLARATTTRGAFYSGLTVGLSVFVPQTAFLWNIFRVGSCGIPQLVASSGRVLATAPFPGEGATIAGELRLVERGRLPLDHWLAPLCVVVTVGIALWFAFQTAFARWFHR